MYICIHTYIYIYTHTTHLYPKHGDLAPLPPPGSAGAPLCRPRNTVCFSSEQHTTSQCIVRGQRYCTKPV